MKKILALVLALVMTMSLATISSGAAFSDADSVQYTEAVNALTAYGVLGGYADGSIRPQADVTRGAAAKMVAMVATGSNATTIGYYKGTSTFADVPATHTFADAVAFCVARGIVAGYGDGTYGVADNVKGWAVAKMALVAMGYDAKAFGMEGAGSALNTITLASQKHLFDGMAADFNATEAASREECAQIVYNAMKQTTVSKGAVNSDGSYTYVGSTAKLADNYNAIVTGVVVENGANKAGVTTTKVGTTTLAVATGLELIGHKVQYVDSGAYSKDGVVPFAVVDLSYEVVVADGTKTLDKAAFSALFGAETVAAAGTVVEFADYAVADTAYAAVPAYGADVLDGTYVFDEAGKLVAFKAPATFEVGYVSSYTAGTAKADGTLDVTGDSNAAWTLFTKTEGTTLVSFYDGIAKDDVVAVQKTGNMSTITKLATVSGVVSQMNTKAGEESVTIGGKTYAQSALFASANLGFSNLATSWLGADVTLYLDINGAYVGVIATPGAAAAAGSVVYVVDSYTIKGASTTDAYGTTTAAPDAYYAQAVDTNGKEVSLLVKSLSDVKLGLQVATSAYDSTDKVDYYTFTATPAATETWKIAANAVADEATAMKIADNYYYASDVKFFYVDEGKADTKADLKVEVKSGVQAAPVAAEYYAVQVGETANYNVQYVFVKGAFSAGNVKSDDIVYVAATGASTDKKAYTKADGSVGTSFVQTVYINGELKTVDSVDETLTAGFCGYEINEYGLYDFVALAATAPKATGTVSNLYGTKLSVTGMTADLEAKDAKIVDVYYALDAGTTADLVEVTTLEGLAGLNVAVVYNVDATGAATSYATIYVLNRVA